MNLLFDYKCPDGHVHEMLVSSKKHRLDVVQCLTCHKPAVRMLAAPRCQLEGITGHFPGAAMAWEKRRESHMKKEQKHKEQHDTWR